LDLEVLGLLNQQLFFDHVAENIATNLRRVFARLGRGDFPTLQLAEVLLLEIEARDDLIADHGDNALELNGARRLRWRGSGLLGGGKRRGARQERCREKVCSHTTEYPRPRARVRPWPSIHSGQLTASSEWSCPAASTAEPAAW